MVLNRFSFVNWGSAPRRGEQCLVESVQYSAETVRINVHTAAVAGSSRSDRHVPGGCRAELSPARVGAHRIPVRRIIVLDETHRLAEGQPLYAAPTALPLPVTAYPLAYYLPVGLL